MAAPGIRRQCPKTNNDSRPDRIQVDVSHQLEKIRVFVANDGPVSVLKKVAGTLVTQIEHHGVAGQQAPHDLGQGSLFRLQQQMEVVIEQDPGVASRLGFRQESAEAGNKIFPVLIVKENGTFFDPSDDDVLKQAGDIYAGMSGHKGNILLKLKISSTSPLIALIAWLGLKKRQQVLAEPVFVRVGDAMWRAGIGDQLGVFDDPR